MSHDNIPAGGAGGAEASTFVVAASDSLDTSRADYVCPAVDALDYITTTVIAALPAGGGSIHLLEGTYTGSTQDKSLKISGKSKITIKGQGKGTKLAIGAGVSVNIIEVLNSSDITIENLLCDGTGGPGGGAETLENGIYSLSSTHLTIQDVWCVENPNNGICIKLGTNCKLNRCHATGNTHSGCYITFGSGTIVSSGRFYNNTRSGIHCYDTVTAPIIVNNTIESNGRHGVLVEVDGYYAVIANNYITDNVLDGVQLNESYYCIVNDNMLTKGQQLGVYLENADHNSIHDNMMFDNSKGVATYGGVQLITSDYNSIEDNIIRKGAGTTHQFGIAITSGTGNIVSGNDCYTAGSASGISDGGTNTIFGAGNRNNDGIWTPGMSHLTFGCIDVITPNATSYLVPGNGLTQTNELKMRVLRAGKLLNLYVKQRVASGGAGLTDIYTVRINGVDKTITCTLDNATEGADTTHSETVAAGDEISIKLVSNNGADTSADVVATLEFGYAPG